MKRSISEALHLNGQTEFQRDLRKAGQAVERLQKLAAGVKNVKRRGLNIAVRPVDELREKQYRLFREYGHKTYREHGHTKYAVEIVPRTKVWLAQSDSATGFYFGSSGLTEFYSNRFIIGHDGTVDYCRESFDIEGKPTGTEPIERHGLEAVTQDEDTRSELLWLDQHMTGKHPHEWHSIAKALGSTANSESA